MATELNYEPLTLQLASRRRSLFRSAFPYNHLGRADFLNIHKNEQFFRACFCLLMLVTGGQTDTSFAMSLT